ERPLRDVAELFSVMRKVVNSDSSRLRAIQDLLDTHPRLIVFYSFDYELEELRRLSQELGCHLSSSTESLESSRSGRSSSPNTSGDFSRSTSTTETGKQSSSTSESSSREKPGSSSSTCSTEPATTDGTSTSTPFEVAEWNGHNHDPIPTGRKWAYLVQYAAGSEGWNCITTDTVVFYSLTYSYKNFEQDYGRIDRLNTPFEDLHYYVLKSDSVIDDAVWRSLMANKSFNRADL